MKNFKLTVLMLISATAYSSNNMPSPATTANKNINIVCIEGRQLLQSSDEGKEIEKKLTSARQQIENEIKNLEQRIQSEATNLQNKSKLLNMESLEAEQDKILKLKKEYDIKAGQAQEEFQRKVNLELAKFQKKIQDSIKDVAIKNGWDVVVMKESGEVIYSSEKADKTSEILQYLNKNYSETKKPAVTKNKA